jgi:predicted phage terminase large subunit-like protein
LPFKSWKKNREYQRKWARENRPVTEKSLARDRDRKRAKTDRLFLANEVLGYDFSPETHAELFSQYPEFKEGEPWSGQFANRDVLILWPRGHFKTTAVMVVLVIQAIIVNPEIRILIMQGSVRNTRERLREIATHFLGSAHGSRFSELFPEFCEAEDAHGHRSITKKGLNLSLDQLTTPARQRKQIPQATVTVASPRTVKTGQHFDLGIFDDLVNDQNYRSRALLRKVQEDFDMCFPLIEPGCPRFVSGTRYAFGDLYEVIIRRNGGEWKISLTTCWKNDDPGPGIPRFPASVGKDGNSHGFTKEILNQILRDSPSIFASQYLNKPMLESQQILTKEDLERATIIPAQAPPLSPACLFIDLAAEGDTEPDDSVVIIGKTDGRGNMYAVGGNGGRWTIPQLANNVIVYALQCRPLKILIEETASAKYFVEYVRMVCRDKGVVLPLDYIKVDNRKDAKATRIKAYAGHVKNGRLKFFVGLPYWEKLTEQSVKFQAGAKHQHDDYPDTMALMCTTFAGRYLSIPADSIPQTRHSVVALLDRDVAMTSIDSMGREFVTQEETMGSEFAA